MKSAEIRRRFLDYFAANGHTEVESASLIPHNDPTLMFTAAGMVPFKDCFLGAEKRAYTRATTAQRCVRAGGKHNDLENVGYTARHHTFFEMLGNFSFGDYFKREAIQFAWEFLTKELGLPEEKLWITVHVSDDEAEKIWKEEMGVSPERFSKLDEDNFWSAGDVGPCGPSTEIFYDHGADVAGGPPGSPDEDGDRYIEIWNLVFMQYDRDEAGNKNPLPNPSIDTGMGLERLAAVLQNVHSNYEIDIFANLIKAASEVIGCTDLENRSLRVVADHIRSCAFLIADGVLPSNEGKGYVLRRIIRRALRHGNKIGAPAIFFSKLVDALIAEMGEAYPILKEQRDNVVRALHAEEEQFGRTLANGMKLLEAEMQAAAGKQIDGETVFKLYDTYGFPADLTADVARENGFSIDEAGFETAMEAQRQRARDASNFKSGAKVDLSAADATKFEGYDSLSQQAKVVALFKEGTAVESLAAGEAGRLVLDQTPFYAESGGQCGDTGFVFDDANNIRVTDCQKQGDIHLHSVEVLKGEVQIGQAVSTSVDADEREAIARHHSATHLAHAALRQILGEHVEQKGSMVTADRLRFDFAHNEALSVEQIEAIEALVNQQIVANSEVSTKLMNMDEAKDSGAMMLFGEKYGDEVRVLAMGEDRFSVELCGGTHVQRTGDIGYFRILNEGGIASGVRRIEAVTGPAAAQYLNDNRRALSTIGATLKSAPEMAAEKVIALTKKTRELEKQLEQLQQKLAASAGADLASSAQEINGIKLVTAKVEAQGGALRDMVDQLKDKLGSGVVLLAADNDGKVSLAAGVTKDLIGTIKAGDLVRQAAEKVDGRGGGKPDFAQAGGKNPAGIDDALQVAVSLLS